MSESQPKLDQQTILQAAMTVAQDPPSLRYWEEGGDLGCTWPEWTGILSSAGWPSVEKSGYKHRLLFPRSWLLALARELKLPRSSVVRLSITDRSDGKRGPIRRSPEDARNRSVLCNEDEYRVLMKVLWWLRDAPKNREKLLRLIKVLGRE